jgi:hypothetical protein
LEGAPTGELEGSKAQEERCYASSTVSLDMLLDGQASDPSTHLPSEEFPDAWDAGVAP